jgi:hypothetical protein
MSLSPPVSRLLTKVVELAFSFPSCHSSCLSSLASLVVLFVLVLLLPFARLAPQNVSLLLVQISICLALGDCRMETAKQ